MGQAMGRKLLEAGHELTVWNRTAARCAELASMGARVATTPADAARNAEAVLSIVLDPAAVCEISLGECGVLSALPSDAVHAEMSTIDPSTAGSLADRYAGAGRLFCHAPVIGSTPQIAAGALITFAGGPETALSRATPAWNAFCTRVWPLPAASQAATCKLAMNLMLAHMMAGLGQAMLFAQAGGINPGTWLDILGSTAMAAPLWEWKGRKFLSRDMSAQFFVQHMLKDHDLALQTARQTGAPLPLAALVRELLVTATAHGWGEEDYTSLIRSLELLAGKELHA